MATKEEIQEKLLELAAAQQVQTERLPIAKQMRASMFEMYVAEYDNEIRAINYGVDALEVEAREMLKEYLEETGDTQPHEAVSLIRSKKIKYDVGEVITTLLDEDRRDLLRIELKVRDFEGEWKQGKLAYVQAEEVLNPTWRIGSLGDLLIVSELEAKGNQDAPGIED